MGRVHFRAGVVAVVSHPDGRVMAFERADVTGQWQLPQGGIDVGETPLEAAWRELGEETGLGSGDVELAGVHPDWTVYELPPAARRKESRLGQAHRWFFFRVRRPDVTPRPDQREFVAWKWMDVSELIGQVVDFRRPSYRSVLQPWRDG